MSTFQISSIMRQYYYKVNNYPTISKILPSANHLLKNRLNKNWTGMMLKVTAVGVQAVINGENGESFPGKVVTSTITN